MKKAKIQNNIQARRKARIRARIKATVGVPRLSVFRSNTNVYVQLIDDVKGVTIASASMKGAAKAEGEAKMTARVAKAFSLGKEIAKKAKAVGVTKVVFDRGGYAYHGRVKALADGAREGGLQF